MSTTGDLGGDEPAAVDLGGSWQKIDGPEGDLGYPDVLEINVVVSDAGRYIGRKGSPEQRFLQWDAGTWRLTKDGRIEISTATDAIESWPVTVSGDELQIEVAERVLTYRRRTTGPDE